MRDATTRRDWIRGELAAMRVPDLTLLNEPQKAPTVREAAAAWQAGRVDVRPATTTQHAVAINRMLPIIGDIRVDALTVADVNRVVAELHDAGKARESIRKTRSALSMILDDHGIVPNPARDRNVRLPREEADEIEPPVADHVEAAGRLLTPAYRRGLVVLDATGCRVGEFEAAKVADLDERRHAWLVRSAVSKTKKPRWVELDADVWDAIIAELPPREDRDPEMPLFPGVTADRIRTAIARSCRAAGVPEFSPHDLRHRRISLWHAQGVPWAEIGRRVGQRNLSVTADRYTHALLDDREIDRAPLLRARSSPVPGSPGIPAEFTAAGLRSA
jgi:integrase